MSDVLKSRDAKDVEDAVRWALSNDKALELVGRGTKRGFIDMIGANAVGHFQILCRFVITDHADSATSQQAKAITIVHDAASSQNRTLVLIAVSL